MVVKDQEHVTVVDWLMDLICIPEKIWPQGEGGLLSVIIYNVSAHIKNTSI